MNRENAKMVGWSLFAILWGTLFFYGCASQLTPATQKSIDNNRQQTAIKIDAIKQQGKVDAANAATNPVKHPFVATQQVVKHARRPLSIIALVSFVALGASVGIAFTPLSAISKVAVPIAGAVFVLTFGGLIVLPFTPWIFLGADVAGAALVIYEIVRYRKKIFARLEAEAAAMKSGITFLHPQPK